MPSKENKDDRGRGPLPARRQAAEARPPDGHADSGSAAGQQGGVPLSRWVLFLAITLCGTAADLATKSWIFHRLGPPNGFVEWIWPNYFGWELSLNEGALFGLGQGWVPLFATLSFVAAAAILYGLFVCGAARDLWLCIALALITAGICGNLYDRLGLPGLTRPVLSEVQQPPERIHAVRDWILLKYGEYRWPNFNIADSLLVCGACLLLAQLAFERKRQPSQPHTA